MERAGFIHGSLFGFKGKELYQADIVRSCIRPLAEFTAKAVAKVPNDLQLQNLLNYRPNMYMSGNDFLQKCRTRLELQNNVFIYIQRDEKNHVTGFYPVPYQSFEALEYMNGLFIQFNFNSGAKSIVLPWEDIAVVRKDYNKSDIAGDDNEAILNTLDMLATTDEGLANSIKATANLRGILKSTKAMLASEDVKKQKDQFVSDYLSLENKGGIASLDATQEFIPIKMEPFTASFDMRREYRENVYRYFGVNEKIVTSDMTPEEVETFYELRIEPFLVRLSTELTSKVYSSRAIGGYKNTITYEANKLQFCSLEKKISLFKEVVVYGGMTINEWREGCNMAPVEGGDERIMRLDAQTVNANEGN